MIILLLFAFLAGLVTAISPCILPVLPLLLSAGIGKNYHRPLAIVIGLIVSLTFFTLSLTTIVRTIGISADTLRYLSIVLIILFGLTMIVPRLEKFFSRLTSPFTRLGNRLENSVNQQPDGFGSGLLVGIALGLIWSPCAGPILATITTLVATEAITWSAVIITLAYSIGTALPMFLIMYGGNKIRLSMSSLAPYTESIRKLFGVIMILAAVAIALHLDDLVQQAALRYFPTISIEDNELVKKELELLQNKTESAHFVVGDHAPDLIGLVDWINSPGLTLEQLKGKLVLVDFWTYSCINCVRTLPHLKQWYATYKDKGFVIVGIHTPEFEFEKNFDNVKDATKRFGLEYPVALDNAYKTWQNYNNLYWPAHYLIDQQGIIRYIHFGEGHYEDTENMIRSLLGLSSIEEKPAKERAKSSQQQTPETYLGYTRAGSYTPEIVLSRDKIATYTYENVLALNQVGLKGDWLIGPDYITAKNNACQLTIHFAGDQVYLVMSAGQSSLMTVLLDGQSVQPSSYSKDMDAKGNIVVKESRMYEIVTLKNNAASHVLTLQVPDGVSLYAFTFGSDGQ